MRIRMDLAYEGTDFHGWAAQPGLRTVQGTLEAALATLLRVPSVSLVCAGRTDTGVHARGQVTHLDVDDDALAQAAGRSTQPVPEALLPRLNGILPPDVRVRRVVAAADGFDARFSALWRRYCYRIADRAETVDPLARRHVLAWPRPLDLDAMNEASAALLGEHDFASFCRAARGRDHDPDPARARVGPGRRRSGGRDGPGRRVLPQHGPVPGRLPARGRGGSAAGPVGGRDPAGRRPRPGGDRRPGARAHPRGGLLPAGRRARRAGGADEGAAG